jgi:type I restriction enzyme R subunit
MTTPELKFQQHVADFLVREHGYGVLVQADITDPDYALAEDQLWAFLSDTQSETVAKLTDQYGLDARDEVFRALKDELKRAPLWMILRHGLTVRGLTFHCYFPPPRSAQDVAGRFYGRNRITFRPHFYFGAKHEEIDFVFFLNGLPIVAMELKHEAGAQGWNVHDAVAQSAVAITASGLYQY